MLLCQRAHPRLFQSLCRQQLTVELIPGFGQVLLIVLRGVEGGFQAVLLKALPDSVLFLCGAAADGGGRRRMQRWISLRSVSLYCTLCDRFKDRQAVKKGPEFIADSVSDRAVTQFFGRLSRDSVPVQPVRGQCQTLFSLSLFSILQKNRIENNSCLFIFFYTARHNSFFEYRQYGF